MLKQERREASSRDIPRKIKSVAAAGLALCAFTVGMSHNKNGQSLGLALVDELAYLKVHQHTYDEIISSLGGKVNICFDEDERPVTNTVAKKRCADMLKSATMALVYDPKMVPASDVKDFAHDLQIEYGVVTDGRGKLDVTDIPLAPSVAAKAEQADCAPYDHTHAYSILDAQADKAVNDKDFVMSLNARLNCKDDLSQTEYGTINGTSRTSVGQRFMDIYNVDRKLENSVGGTTVDYREYVDSVMEHEMLHTVFGLHHSTEFDSMDDGMPGNDFTKITPNSIANDQYRDGSTIMGHKQANEHGPDKVSTDVMTPYEVSQIDELFGMDAQTREIRLDASGCSADISMQEPKKYVIVDSRTKTDWKPEGSMGGHEEHYSFPKIGINVWNPPGFYDKSVNVYLLDGVDDKDRPIDLSVQIASVQLEEDVPWYMTLGDQKLPFELIRHNDTVTVTRTA